MSHWHDIIASVLSVLLNCGNYDCLFQLPFSFSSLAALPQVSAWSPFFLSNNARPSVHLVTESAEIFIEHDLWFPKYPILPSVCALSYLTISYS